MPKSGITQAFDLNTRNDYTKVAAEISLKVDGRELPNLDVLGRAMEEAIEVFRKSIKESYQVVPARDGTTELAKPYGTI